MRDYYKIVHADWFSGVNDAKKEAKKIGQPFTKVLKEGQASGKWPNTPVVEKEFLAFQTQKMELIRQHVLALSDAEAVKSGLREVGIAEVEFYRVRGLFEQYCEANAI